MGLPALKESLFRAYLPYLAMVAFDTAFQFGHAVHCCLYDKNILWWKENRFQLSAELDSLAGLFLPERVRKSRWGPFDPVLALLIVSRQGLFAESFLHVDINCVHVGQFQKILGLKHVVVW